MHHRTRPPRGQTLLTVLIAAAIGGVVLVAIMATMKHLNRGSQTVGEKNDRHDLKQLILDVFSDPNNCTCQLDSAINTARASVLFVDTTASPIPPIDLGILRSGCSFTSTTNIIAKDGTLLRGAQADLTIDKVRVTEIAATGSTDQYSATLEIGFTTSAGPIRPLVVHILLLIDSSAGAANHRRIAQCLGPPNSLGKMIAAQCTVRHPATVAKGPCGVDARVICNPGEMLLSGGSAFGSNLALQNSAAVLDSNQQPVGWAVSWLDTNACSINAYADGTTKPGTNPCFPSPTAGGYPLCGGVMAVCCQ